MRASLSAEDEDAFEVARGHAEHYLVDQFERRSPGLALFAAGGSEDIMVVPLPAAPSDHVVWSKRPSIAPLETMLDEHERVAVVLFDASEHACSRSFWAPSRQSSTLPTACRANRRPAAGSGSSRPALPATAKTTCVGTPSEPSKLMVLLRNYSFDRLLPAGPDEALTVLKRELPRPLSARLAGTMVAAGGW